MGEGWGEQKVMNVHGGGDGVHHADAILSFCLKLHLQGAENDTNTLLWNWVSLQWRSFHQDFSLSLLHSHSFLQALNESVQLVNTAFLQSVEEAEWRQQSSAGPWRLDTRGMLLSKLYHSVTQQDQSPLTAAPLPLFFSSSFTSSLFSFCICRYFSFFRSLFLLYRPPLPRFMWSKSPGSCSVHPSQTLQLKH